MSGALQHLAEPERDHSGGQQTAGGVADHAPDRDAPAVGQGPADDEQHAGAGDHDEQPGGQGDRRQLMPRDHARSLGAHAIDIPVEWGASGSARAHLAGMVGSLADDLVGRHDIHVGGAGDHVRARVPGWGGLVVTPVTAVGRGRLTIAAVALLEQGEGRRVEVDEWISPARMR